MIVGSTAEDTDHRGTEDTERHRGSCRRGLAAGVFTPFRLGGNTTPTVSS